MNGDSIGLSTLRVVAVKLAVFSVAAFSVTAPALAQYPPPGSVPGPATIVVSRDVPQRPAFAPGQPGTVNTVEAAPVETIFGVTNGLVSVLSDGESADVAAGIQAQDAATNDAIRGTDPALDPQYGGAAGQILTQSFGGGLSGTIGAPVASATSAIGTALSPLSALGRGE